MTAQVIQALGLFLFTSTIFIIGYSVGIDQERHRQRLRSAMRRRVTEWRITPSVNYDGKEPELPELPKRKAPMEVKRREAAPGPQLPDLSRWKRGGRR